MPLDKKALKDFDLQALVLPYYLNQNPQDNFYFAVEKSNLLLMKKKLTVHTENTLVLMIK